jgi:ketosteroid isomerase-like protein
MSTEQNYHDLTLSLFNAMNSRDFSTLEKNVADHVAFDFPGAGRVEGARRVILFLNALLRKYPKLEFTVSEVLVDKQSTCAIWTNEGISTDGKPYENKGITLIHFREEKIVFISDYFKDTSFVKVV